MIPRWFLRGDRSICEVPLGLMVRGGDFRILERHFEDCLRRAMLQPHGRIPVGARVIEMSDCGPAGQLMVRIEGTESHDMRAIATEVETKALNRAIALFVQELNDPKRSYPKHENTTVPASAPGPGAPDGSGEAMTAAPSAPVAPAAPRSPRDGVSSSARRDDDYDDFRFAPPDADEGQHAQLAGHTGDNTTATVDISTVDASLATPRPQDPTTTLLCPGCHRRLQVHGGRLLDERCPDARCGIVLHSEVIPCADCGAPNVVSAQLVDCACAGGCGSRLPVVSTLGVLPDTAGFAAAASATAAFSEFERRSSPFGEVQYVVVTAGVRLVVWQTPLEAGDPPVLESARALRGLPGTIHLPTQSFVQGSGSVAQRFFTYRMSGAEPTRTAAETEPFDLALGLFELLASTHDSGYALPKMVPADLALADDGRLHLLAGHRLVPLGSRIVSPSRTPYQPQGVTHATRAHDLHVAARIWYATVVGERFLADTNAGDLPHPRLFRPQIPVRLWPILQSCLVGDAATAPRGAREVCEVLRGDRLPSPPVALEFFFHSDVGQKPDGVQQDRCGVVQFNDQVLAAVADGVSQGGRGHIAAELAVSHLTGAPCQGTTVAAVTNELKLRIDRANTAIGQEMVLRGPGARGHVEDTSTTAIAACAVGGQLTIVSIGDSPAYLLTSDGRLEAITDQHTEGVELLLRGWSVREARESAYAEHLSRWVGRFRHDERSPDLVDPLLPLPLSEQCDSVVVTLRPGDRLLLCTDGVSKFLAPEEISTLLRNHRGSTDIAREIVRAAVDRQPIEAGDNAAAVVIVAGTTAGPADRRENVCVANAVVAEDERRKNDDGISADTGTEAEGADHPDTPDQGQ